MARRSRHRRVLILFFLIASAGLALYLFFIPDVSKLKRENPVKTSFMEYREREWKQQGKNFVIRQKWVPLSRISSYLIKAVLIAEDDKFWSHEGFDYEAIQKAVERDIKLRKFKLGASTISQQLAKNLYLSPQKNILRKIREAIITWRIEQALTKKRILELYLNIAEWGEKGIFGIEMASRHYYGKSASELTPHESSRLAAVLPNPVKYSPLSEGRFVTYRSNLIYSIMLKRGIVVPEYEEVIEEEKQDENMSALPEMKESQIPAETETKEIIEKK